MMKQLVSDIMMSGFSGISDIFSDIFFRLAKKGKTVLSHYFNERSFTQVSYFSSLAKA